jgi:hypothetical protein|tara:strand:+ start:2841 stop:3242 length:402 start_codon:yes stop_codon:yes gene_type:complete
MYILLVDNVVVQKQPSMAKGFVWTDQDVVCGQIEKDGVFTNPKPSLPTQDQYMQKAQSVMDAQAQSMGYDNIFTAISYIGDPFPRFNDEAVALRAYRSQVWQHSNDLMAQVLAGDVAQPTLEEYEQGLPDFTL